eukprot:6391134-Prymnesium_polylepis.1
MSVTRSGTASAASEVAMPARRGVLWGEGRATTEHGTRWTSPRLSLGSWTPRVSGEWVPWTLVTQSAALKRAGIKGRGLYTLQPLRASRETALGNSKASRVGRYTGTVLASFARIGSPGRSDGATPDREGAGQPARAPRLCGAAAVGRGSTETALCKILHAAAA